MLFFGPVSAGATFAARYLQYRKLVHLEEEKAFDAELLAARALEERKLH
jgi:hypothetical protein